MKKIFAFLLAFTLITSLPVLVFAQSGGNTQGSASGGNTKSSASGGNTGKIQNPLGSKNANLPAFLKSILRIVFLLGTIVVVFFIIFAGFKYVIAQGDPGKLKEAHAMLLWSVIGAVILLGAQTIAAVIENTVKQLGA